ncbi:alpha-glucosidase [Paenibacillus urinalis]|uniref:oligo-1,6-glucosidase n=1 Tax=Paenibacillus urinalis TaxID=521520 RepID=A0ABY7XFA2_9BACL|nr:MULTISPECIES: alpha-glucosidase [Paenibacillus]WDH96250.1 alpha-glucosidase [Paenibacillus urinalis]WDI04473.1 alpha-glucosidase [Paenibacillus urinalis]
MKKQWWKESVVYQIYPRSFMDSNGDGIGDLQGIISKLDYLKKLGVDVVWLCPVYDSPNDDNGYDIRHYQQIMDEFGTMADWEELLEGLHERGMKLIMDLVVNHTSDEHAWFVEAQKSMDNGYRDYYIWRPGKNGEEPSNWMSYFRGSAWQHQPETDEYYLHLFSKKQPDLNWENERVRKEVYQMMTWWLDKGIDGFRMDVINLISKDQRFPDAEETGDSLYHWGGKYFVNGPKVHEYLQEMNREVLSKYDIMTVGECLDVSPEEAVNYVAEDRNELNMVFHFELMNVGSGPLGKWDIIPWKLTDFKRVMHKWQQTLKDRGWNSLYLNNHDQPRMVSRFGNDDRYRIESAKLLGTLLHTLKGTPYIYQGEEIGMTNVNFASIEDYRDIETLNMFHEYTQSGHQHDLLMQSIYERSRDNARTPMHWNQREHAGFTTGTPWIQLNPNYTAINVEEALSDPNSVFYYYQKLIQLRKEHPIIVYGDYELLHEEDEQIYAYTRSLEQEMLIVVLNFSEQEAEFMLNENIKYSDSQLLIHNYEIQDKGISKPFTLKPFEARVYKLLT